MPRATQAKPQSPPRPTRRPPAAGAVSARPGRAAPKVDAADDEMSIGVLAKRVGLPPATINFYVSAGVLPPPRKLSRTRAAYNTRHQRVLKLVRVMQGSGFSLASIKALFDHHGVGDDALQRLEGIGYLQPLPPAPTDPDQRPIEHFDPVSRREFVAKLGRKDAAKIVALLEEHGMLRTKRRGQYDARDLWLVRTVFALLDDAVGVDEVAALAKLGPVLQRLAPVIVSTADRHQREIRSRTVRMRDLFAPYEAIIGYLLERYMTEHEPGWRERIFSVPR